MKAVVVAFLCAALAGCAVSYKDAGGFDRGSQALFLMVIEETPGPDGFGTARIRLGGEGRRAFFRTLLDAADGARSPDFDDGSKVVTHRAIAVEPGRYAMDLWQFMDRQGVASRSDIAYAVAAQAGGIYYLGRFRADGRLRVSSLADAMETDLPGLREKFPYLAGVEVVNKAPRLVHDCWAQEPAKAAYRDGAGFGGLPESCFQ